MEFFVDLRTDSSRMNTLKYSAKKRRSQTAPARGISTTFKNDNLKNVFRDEQLSVHRGLRGRLRGCDGGGRDDLVVGEGAEAAVRPHPPRHLQLGAAARQAGGDALVQGRPPHGVGAADPLPGLRPPPDRRQAPQDTSGQKAALNCWS